MMSKQFKKKIKSLSASSQDPKRFVQLNYHLIKSNAFKEVSGGAFKLYIKVRERFNGVNNGEIGFSVRDASNKLGIAPMTAHKYFKELEEKGFLKTRVKGSYNFKSRHATTWIITAERYNHKAPSNDFMSWPNLNTSK